LRDTTSADKPWMRDAVAYFTSKVAEPAGLPSSMMATE
jgi:hypothetical protein